MRTRLAYDVSDNLELASMPRSAVSYDVRDVVGAIRGPYWGYGLLVALTARAQSDEQIRIAPGHIVYDVSSIFYVNIGIATDVRVTAQRPSSRPIRRHVGSQN